MADEKAVPYSPELLQEAHDLLADFRSFMGANLINTDKGRLPGWGKDKLTPACEQDMAKLIRYSLDEAKKLYDLFKLPLLKHEEENKKVLAKVLPDLVAFFHRYIRWAGPILQRCQPYIYTGRFAGLKKRYADFCDKWLS